MFRRRNYLANKIALFYWGLSWDDFIEICQLTYIAHEYRNISELNILAQLCVNVAIWVFVHCCAKSALLWLSGAYYGSSSSWRLNLLVGFDLLHKYSPFAAVSLGLPLGHNDWCPVNWHYFNMSNLSQSLEPTESYVDPILT